VPSYTGVLGYETLLIFKHPHMFDNCVRNDQIEGAVRERERTTVSNDVAVPSGDRTTNAGRQYVKTSSDEGVLHDVLVGVVVLGDANEKHRTHIMSLGERQREPGFPGTIPPAIDERGSSPEAREAHV
jgi:hypothetical protein